MESLSCPICFCSYNLQDNYPYSLPCGHSLCKMCYTAIKNSKPLCPLDKKNFTEGTKNFGLGAVLEDLLGKNLQDPVLAQIKQEIKSSKPFAVSDKGKDIVPLREGVRIITYNNLALDWFNSSPKKGTIGKYTLNHKSDYWYKNQIWRLEPSINQGYYRIVSHQDHALDSWGKETGKGTLGKTINSFKMWITLGMREK